MKTLFTYIRYDGWSQSSFPQTIPVKTFKPPEMMQKRRLKHTCTSIKATDWHLRVSSLTCASECLSRHFSGFRVSQMDYLCRHKRHGSQIYFEDGNESRVRHTAPPTCRASWWGWQRSWWSSWGTQSCQCLSGWCCRFSLGLDLRMEGCTHREAM